MGSGTRRGFRITTTSYTAHGLTSSVAEPSGDATQFGYDLADRQVTRTNALGRVTTSVYDAGNRRVAVQPPGGGITSTVYDCLDRPAMVVSPIGCISTTTYDAAGRVSAEINGLGETTSYGYDLADHRIRVVDGEGNISTTLYDAAGRLLPITPDFAGFLLASPEPERRGKVFKLNGLWTGKPMTPRRVGRVISAFGRKADVIVNRSANKYASAHDFRRAFGTRWSRKIMPSVLQKLMRHDSIETTLRYCAFHRTRTSLRGHRWLKNRNSV